MGKTYLVTGGAGFLGRKFCEVLCARNVDGVSSLKLLDVWFPKNLRQSQAEICREANITVQWIETDICQHESVRSAVEGSDVVIHMASVIDVYRTMTWEDVTNVNVDGSLNLLRACLEANVKYFVYTSSYAVVGPNNAGDPFVDGDEETPYTFHSTDPYPATKREAETKVLEANGKTTADGSTLVTCALRPSFMYGEGDVYLEEAIVNASNKNLIALSKRSEKLSHLYVGNAAWCHVLAAQKIQVRSKLIGGNAYFIKDDSPPDSYTSFRLNFCQHRGFSIAKPEPILPRWALLIIATIMSLVSKLFAKMGVYVFQKSLNPFIVRMTCGHFTVSNVKFQRHFDYVPMFGWDEAKACTRRYVDEFLNALAIKSS